MINTSNVKLFIKERIVETLPALENLFWPLYNPQYVTNDFLDARR